MTYGILIGLMCFGSFTLYHNELKPGADTDMKKWLNVHKSWAQVVGRLTLWPATLGLIGLIIQDVV